MHHILYISSNPREGGFEGICSLLPGYSIVEAADTAEIRQYLDRPEGQPALLLADCRAQTDLEAFCRALDHLRQPAQVPFLVIIGDPAQREAVFQAGADDYLLLPVQPDECAARLEQHLRLAELSRAQREAHTSAAQMAFVVLLSRLLNERLDLPSIFSQTLQQTVDLFNASEGELWLFAEDGQSLSLVSSLSSDAFQRLRGTLLKRGQGLIGWISEVDGPLRVQNPAEEAHFDANVDQFGPRASSSALLAVRLSSASRKLGVLALYAKHAEAFPPQDVALLGEVADLASAAIANAQEVDALRHYAEQQHILNEMSQQIAAGLDLQATLNRAAQWIGRLSSTEFVFIWLVNEDAETLQLAASLGVGLPKAALEIPLACLPDGRALIQELSEVDDRLIQALRSIIGGTPRNVLVIPMRQRRQKLGMAALLNRVGEPFRKADLGLLTTACDVISISINNALLHSQTMRLMEERERLHQQAMQNERLRTIGRLTASLAHEINNPMQAIRGALTLALEDINNPDDLQEYLTLGQHEANRVVKLVNRMRQLYRPQGDQAEMIRLPGLLSEVLEIAREEMMEQKVKVETSLPPDLPAVYGVLNQLHLAFLSLALHLSDAIGAAGGGKLVITGRQQDEEVYIRFSTPAAVAPALEAQSSLASSDQRAGQIGALYGLPLTADVVAANHGRLELIHEDGRSIVQISLSLK